MVNDVTAPKNMILTSKQHAKYLFASWNTQQASYPKRRAAVLYISSMGLMYWLDWLLGQENQFYSIGVFWVYIWWWCSVCCCIMGWRDRFYNIGGICCVVVCQFCEFVVGWSVCWFGLVSLIGWGRRRIRRRRRGRRLLDRYLGVNRLLNNHLTITWVVTACLKITWPLLWW